MRRTLLILAVVSLAAVSCGDGSSVPLDAGTTSTTGVAADSTTSSTDASIPPTTGSSGSPPSTSSPTSTVADDRPVAPDFVLELGSGGTFVLSEETRPVYLVFWAEW